jgi:hypothetical protein
VCGTWTFSGARRGSGSLPTCGAILLTIALANVAAQSEAANTRSARARARAELASRVERVMGGKYMHGLPGDSVLALGDGVLPVLAELLRTESKRKCWGNAAWAIGFLGDTGYFDTLRAFVWERHRGRINDETLVAILTAQGSIGRLASKSTMALDYMFDKTDAASWRSLPWRISSSPGMTQFRLASVTVSYLSRIDRERLEGFASSLRARRRAGDRTATQVDSITWHNIEEMNRRSRGDRAARKSTTEMK